MHCKWVNFTYNLHPDFTNFQYPFPFPCYQNIHVKTVGGGAHFFNIKLREQLSLMKAHLFHILTNCITISLFANTLWFTFLLPPKTERTIQFFEDFFVFILTICITIPLSLGLFNNFFISFIIKISIGDH